MMEFSISRVKLFKACRRAYELKYIEGLEPVERPESLEVGTSYHKKLEELYKTGTLDTSDLSRESAMAAAYMKYIYPQFKMKLTEDWFREPILDHDLFVGRVDGITDDGVLVEHKTTSQEIGEDYEFYLAWDEQILAYMHLTHINKMWYTVCRKPTIRQRRGETDEGFFERMVAWYDEDTLSKIRLLKIERTAEEVEEFRRELDTMVGEIKGCKHFYRNTSHCTRYGRRCEYFPICLCYNREQTYIEFRRRDEKD